VPGNLEKVFWPNLAAFQHQLQPVEAARLFCMGAAEWRARREPAGKCERRKVQLLERMRRCVATTEHDTANAGLLDERQQQAPQRGAKSLAIDSS